MEVASWKLHNGRYLVELTPRKLPHGPYIMEVTSWNIHHGSYLMELTPWKLPHGTYTMEVASGAFTMEVTSWNLHHGSYLMELRLSVYDEPMMGRTYCRIGSSVARQNPCFIR